MKSTVEKLNEDGTKVYAEWQRQLRTGATNLDWPLFQFAVGLSHLHDAEL